jgi:hypothetical protein
LVCCIVQFSKVIRRLATRLSYQSPFALSRLIAKIFNLPRRRLTVPLLSIRTVPLRQ